MEHSILTVIASKLFALSAHLSTGLYGAILNSVLVHHARGLAGLASTSILAKILSGMGAILIGLGCVWIGEAAYEWSKLEPQPKVLKAIFFAGSVGGIELVLWFVNKADKIADSLESEALKRLSEFRKSRRKPKNRES